jgi:hypothetical protein
MFETTYQGLMNWYAHEMEIFGWMIVIGQSQEEKEGFKAKKLSLYIDTLIELRDSIKAKLDQIKEEDRQKDLLIIHGKLLKFIPVAQKVLTPLMTQEGGAKKKGSKKSSKKYKK